MGDNFSIFVSTTPFGIPDSRPLEALHRTGWNVRFNNFGRKLTAAEVAELAADCDGIIAGTEDLGPLLDRNAKLKIISRVGVGLDSVPLSRCRERRITVTYTPQAVTPAVAEFTIGAMLSVCRSIASADRAVRNQKWPRPMGLRLGVARIGIVGFGRIGSLVGRLLTGFRPLEILVNDICDKSGEIDALSVQNVSVRSVEFEELLQQSDIVTLHVPMTANTRNMIGDKQLRMMKPSSYLLNTSRGGVIDELALYNCLQEGRLAGAAIDVFEKEPYIGPLSHLDTALVTSHLASCSADCRAKMETEGASDLISYLSGKEVQGAVPESEYESQRLPAVPTGRIG